MEITNNWIYFQATEQQAQQLDAIYVKSKLRWRLPNNLGALRELYKQGFDVLEHGKKKAVTREKLLARKTLEPLTDEMDLTKLRPYQRMDINFLSSLPHCGVFSEMRTGKSPTAIKLMEAEGHEKIIVVCPASLVLNWCNEVKKWHSLEATAVKGTKKQREKIYQSWNKGFLVLSKDIAKADADLLNFSNYALIVDESHFLRNYKSLQSKAIFKLGKNAIKRIAMTGTPATNKGDDLFGILHFLYPDKFSSYWQFVDRYFKTWNTPWGSRDISGYKRKEELQEILDLISVQRKRSEVMAWVPQKQYQTIEVEMSAKQRKSYKDMLETFTVIEDSEIKADAPSVLSQLTRLRQICLSPDLLNINAPSAKEEFVMEWLDDNPGESVVVFSCFSSYLKKLHEKIKGSRLIIGETPLNERQSTVESFQSGKTRIILANIQAAGVGLTLDQGSTVIFLDRDFTPANNAQAEDRIIPTTESSNQSSLIIDVVCANSIDERINSLLSKKKNIIEVVNNYKNIREWLE